jgi:hypothetical protein
LSRHRYEAILAMLFLQYNLEYNAGLGAKAAELFRLLHGAAADACSFEGESRDLAKQCRKRPSIGAEQCQKRPRKEANQCQKRPSIEAKLCRKRPSQEAKQCKKTVF